MAFDSDGAAETYAGTEVKNNIFSNNTNQMGAWVPSGVTIDRNFFNGTSSTYGTNAILGDPLFVDFNNRNYHLKSNSPAINNGTNVGISIDFDKTLRPQGSGYDIGAYEYV